MMTTRVFNRPARAVLVASTFVMGLSTIALAVPEPEELPALRQAPNIPVSGLVGLLPDHATGPARDRGAMGKPPPCDKDVDTTSTVFNATTVAAQDNGICTSADIDVYQRDGRTFVVQGGATEGAWTHTEVTDPANPVILGQFSWSGRAGKATTTPDIKAFHQGVQDFIAMGLERTKVTGGCGVIIYDVTVPSAPVQMSQFIGTDWCDTHNVFIENNGAGDGAYIYATADNTADLRVLDIADVTAPVEVGTYRRLDNNPPNDSDVFNDAYVHDVTVVDGIVYAAYWNKGVDIFPASAIKGGTLLHSDGAPNALVTTVKPNNAPGGNIFLSHHAYPADTDGLAGADVVFVEDEITFETGFQPVQMWTTDPAPVHVDGVNLGSDIPVDPAHNLEISSLQSDRLYVGWYRQGLQSWNFDSLGFTRAAVTPDPSRSADAYHQAQTEADDDPYSGAWGVRLADIGGVLYAFQSDRNFGLIIDCLGDGNGSLSGCPAATP